MRALAPLAGLAKAEPVAMGALVLSSEMRPAPWIALKMPAFLRLVAGSALVGVPLPRFADGKPTAGRVDQPNKSLQGLLGGMVV